MKEEPQGSPEDKEPEQVQEDDGEFTTVPATGEKNLKTEYAHIMVPYEDA